MLRAVVMLLPLLAAVVQCATHAVPAEGDAPDAILLAIGRVEADSARVLLDCGGTGRCPRGVSLAHRAAGAGADEWQRLGHYAVGPGPRVVLVTGLLPCTDIELRVLADDEGATEPEEYMARALFSTACADESLRFAVLSCDRYADDMQDDGFVWELAAALRERRIFATFHIGDQIYADKLFDRYSRASFDEALAALRAFYRKSWTRPAMRSVLRTGSHIMVPDDHDLVNAVTPETARNPVYQGYMRAAQTAIYEYQLSLYKDQTITTHPRALPEAAFAHLHYGPLGIVLIDTRFYRSIAEPDLPYELTGRKQVRDFDQLMTYWKAKEHVDEVVVMSSVPLLFPSVPMAKLADWFEGERYPNHPSHQNNTLALLERMWQAQTAGTKVTMIAGDVHMHFEMDVCREDLLTQKELGCMRSYATSGMQHVSCAVNAWHLALFDSIMYWFTPIDLHAREDNVAYHGRILNMHLLNNFMIFEKRGVGQPLEASVVWREPTAVDRVRHLIFFTFGAWLLVAAVAILTFSTIMVAARCARRRTTSSGDTRGAPSTPGRQSMHGDVMPSSRANQAGPRRRFFGD